MTPADLRALAAEARRTAAQQADGPQIGVNAPRLEPLSAVLLNQAAILDALAELVAKENA
jgi:hypothetical protein